MSVTFLKGVAKVPSWIACWPMSSACSKAERRNVIALAVGVGPFPPVCACVCCLIAATTRPPGQPSPMEPSACAMSESGQKAWIM
jgi:hypothetical protein